MSPSPILSDQLTLSLPGGHIMPTTLICDTPNSFPWIFRPSYFFNKSFGFFIKVLSGSIEILGF